jgi:hypothetical protein
MMKGTRFVEIAKGVNKTASRIFSFLSPPIADINTDDFHCWNIVTHYTSQRME